MNDITSCSIGLTTNTNLYFIIAIIFKSIMPCEHEDKPLNRHVRGEKFVNYPVIGVSG